MYSDCEILLKSVCAEEHVTSQSGAAPYGSPNSYQTRIMYNIRWSAQRLGLRHRVRRCRSGCRVTIFLMFTDCE